MQPSHGDIQRWQNIAKRRKAVVPRAFRFLTKKDISVICGNCGITFIRPLIAGMNDPIYVCPDCNKRNYIPIDWNVIRGYGKKKY